MIPANCAEFPCAGAVGGAGGSAPHNSATAPSPSAALSQKIPSTPIALCSGGAQISDSKNTAPMPTPSIAIAVVRCSARVRSAVNASAAAETAPPP